MAASESTKFQVNYKLADGTLVNLYATDVRDLETGLTDLAMVSSLIASTADSFRGNAAPATVHNPAPVASTPTAVSSGQVETIQDRYGNTWTYGIADAPTCVRGPMVLKQGVSKTGKPYKGFFVPASGPKWTGPKPIDLAQTIFTK